MITDDLGNVYIIEGCCDGNREKLNSSGVAMDGQQWRLRIPAFGLFLRFFAVVHGDGLFRKRRFGACEFDFDGQSHHRRLNWSGGRFWIGTAPSSLPASAIIMF
ncbi:MAG: hypothetical protein IPP17_24715 [Bacteroidetes bacterium]|nr:hypothetical protein [Bacteroidota bacterium]